MQEFQGFLVRSLETSKYEVLPLAGDASNRRYYRVIAGNTTYVLMVWEPFNDDDNYPFLSVLRHFQANGVTVPEVYFKSPNEGLILLEDLGDLTLERKFWENQDQSLVLPYYKQAIDQLIRIHFAATFNKSNATCFRIEFDTERLLWEMNYGREHLLLKLCDLKFTEAETKKLDEIFLNICNRLHNQKKYLAHRDFHSRNVMLKLGKARIIDFQDARLGPIKYDLVSLLHDSYVALSQETTQALLDYYLSQRQAVQSQFGLPPISLDEFYEVMELQTIQRCFKACGSFASFYNLRGDTRYVKYLRNTLQTVRRSTEIFPQYAAFSQILDSYGIFDEEFDGYTNPQQ